MWAEFRVGERSADRAAKGRCATQNSHSVTAEQGDSFGTAPKVKAQGASVVKARKVLPWLGTSSPGNIHMPWLWP